MKGGELNNIIYLSEIKAQSLKLKDACQKIINLTSDEVRALRIEIQGNDFEIVNAINKQDPGKMKNNIDKWMKRMQQNISNLESKCTYRNNTSLNLEGGSGERSGAWTAGFIGSIFGDDDDDDSSPSMPFVCVGLVVFIGWAILSPESFIDYQKGMICGDTFGLVCP